MTSPSWSAIALALLACNTANPDEVEAEARAFLAKLGESDYRLSCSSRNSLDPAVCEAVVRGKPVRIACGHDRTCWWRGIAP